jgi:hypothetical protein
MSTGKIIVIRPEVLNKVWHCREMFWGKPVMDYLLPMKYYPALQRLDVCSMKVCIQVRVRLAVEERRLSRLSPLLVIAAISRASARRPQATYRNPDFAGIGRIASGVLVDRSPRVVDIE